MVQLGHPNGLISDTLKHNMYCSLYTLAIADALEGILTLLLARGVSFGRKNYRFGCAVISQRQRISSCSQNELL